MSGHSKWSQIKRQKGLTDAKRGQVFTKLVREIIVAAREGGPDPQGNVRLRLAVQKARDSNMPHDNIDRAIKKGAGGEKSEALESITYEGYGAGGAAILVEALTDNRNRTVSEVRSVFARYNGTLGSAGSVAWNFESTGVIHADVDPAKADDLALAAIDAGAEDVKAEGGLLEVYAAPANIEKVRHNLESAGAKVTAAELSKVPKTTVSLDKKTAPGVLKLLDKLEELDDVQKVYSNADFSDEVLEDYKAGALA